jgi:glycerophosphoryl diester phosphodiesterase
MPVFKTINDETIRLAWKRVLHLWKPMAGWTLLVWVAFSLVLIPLSSAVLGWGIFRGDRLAIGNEDLFAWLMTPAGIIYGLLAGGLALIATVIRFAGLFRMITDDMEGKRVSLKDTLFRIIPYIPKLFKFCVFVVITAVILLIPLTLGLGALYLLFLTEFDINYYLTIQPSEWYYALFGGLFWSVLWGNVVLYLLGKSLLSLPAYLSAERSIREAVKRSWGLAKERTVRLLRLIGFTIGIWILARILIDTVMLFTASQVINVAADYTDSLRLISFLTGGYSMMALLMGAVVGFFGFSFLSAMITKFYYEDSELFIRSVPPPGFRELQNRLAGKINRWTHPVRLTIVFLILFAGSTVTSMFMLSGVSPPGDVLISAHRAGPPPAPENSLAALEYAIRDGADYTEIDVQLTSDGVAVLLHDVDFMRVAGDQRRITDVTYPDVRDLEMFSSEDIPAEERKIVSLHEFLERAEGRIRVMIELKYYGFVEELVPAVIEVVRALQMEDQVVLMSLSQEGVSQARQLSPDIPVGFVSAFAAGDLSRLSVDFLAINQQAITPNLIRSARQRNIDIYPWTVNRVSDLANMIEHGVDGIITDDPALARNVLNQLNNLSNLERVLLRFGSLLIDEENSGDTSGDTRD